MTDRPTALHAQIDDDPGARVDIPTRLVLRYAGSDRAAIADKLVDQATAWFRCDPFDLVTVDLSPARYSRLADGSDWVEGEATFTTRHELKAAADTEALRTRIYSLAREDLVAAEAYNRARGPHRHTLPEEHRP